MPEVVGRLRTPRLAAAPGSPLGGEVYFDTATNKLYWWSGTAWVDASGGSLVASGITSTPTGDVAATSVQGAIAELDTEKVAKDSVVPAATRLVNSKLLVGDANQAFKVQGDGRIDWGPGGASALDVNLYRGGADTLQTDDFFTINRPSSFDYAIQAIKAGAAYPVWRMAMDGAMEWGTGSIPADAFISRVNVGALDLTSELRVSGILKLRSNTAPQLTIGSTGDTNLYRAAANQLATDDAFRIATPGGLPTAFQIRQAADTQPRLSIDNFGTISWGTGGLSEDTGLYRDAVRSLRLGGGLKIEDTLLFGSAGDTNLYRAAADTLKTDDMLYVGGHVGGEVARFQSRTDLASVRSFLSLYTSNGNFWWELSAQDAAGGATTNGLAWRERSGAGASLERLFFPQGGGPIQLLGGGLLFGPAGAAPSAATVDTNLYRVAAASLETTSRFFLRRPSAGDEGINLIVAGESQERFKINTSGYHSWGPGGSVGPDTSLYRAAADNLKTDDTFDSAAGIRSFIGAAAQTIIGNQGPASQAGISFGSTADVSLYRSAADVLKTDDVFHIGPGGVLALNNGGGTQIEFAWSGSSRQYRHRISTVHVGGAVAGNVMDFLLWTSADAIDSLASTRVLRLEGDGKLWIGNALDTNLYRSAANELKTDDTLDVAALKIAGVPFTGSGGGVDYIGNWAAGTGYVRGDVVRYNNVDYLAVNPSTGQTPPPAVVTWAKLTQAQYGALGTPNPTTLYIIVG